MSTRVMIGNDSRDERDRATDVISAVSRSSASGAPASTGYPPLTAWPDDLRAAVLAGSALLPGGRMVDGTPISELDREAVSHFLKSLDGPVDAVAVCGIFSPSFP